MPKHKLSGAQRRKKQKNNEKEAFKSKELMSKSLYSKKAKTDDTESESESEDDSRDENSYQPIMLQRLRTEIIARGSDLFQNKNGPFVANSGGRSMNSTWSKQRLANGDEVGRSWLLYSPVNKAAYCFCCLLFPTSGSNSQSSFESAGEFTNWRHTERLKDHENSPCHRKSFILWKEAERRIIYGKRIDSELEAQFESEKQHWRNILNRTLSCIKVLASQNMALRGHR